MARSLPIESKTPSTTLSSLDALRQLTQTVQPVINQALTFEPPHFTNYLRDLTCRDFKSYIRDLSHRSQLELRAIRKKAKAKQYRLQRKQPFQFMDALRPPFYRHNLPLEYLMTNTFCPYCKSLAPVSLKCEFRDCPY